MRFRNKEDVIQLTPLWEGERYEDGRPRVSDELLERIGKIATEEAWSVLWGRGYKYQFQGEWKTTHGNDVLVGRAVTAVMVPRRPDLHDHLLEYGHKEEGRIGFFNSWVIEDLENDDVMVVDMFDKVYEGTYSGGNLSTAVGRRTGRGQVISGGPTSTSCQT